MKRKVPVSLQNKRYLKIKIGCKTNNIDLHNLFTVYDNTDTLQFLYKISSENSIIDALDLDTVF